MENKQLRWCFKLKDGLRLIEPNERLAKSYLDQARSSLLRAEKDLSDHDLLWATVTIYYAEYYALYSLLQAVGIRCENHTCSILAATLLCGEERIKIINLHKSKRIDAQYYMKIDQEDNVKTMLREAKIFVADFDVLLSGLTKEEIRVYRKRIAKHQAH